MGRKRGKEGERGMGMWEGGRAGRKGRRKRREGRKGGGGKRGGGKEMEKNKNEKKIISVSL